MSSVLQRGPGYMENELHGLACLVGLHILTVEYYSCKPKSERPQSQAFSLASTTFTDLPRALPLYTAGRVVPLPSPVQSRGCLSEGCQGRGDGYRLRMRRPHDPECSALLLVMVRNNTWRPLLGDKASCLPQKEASAASSDTWGSSSTEIPQEPVEHHLVGSG